MVSAQQEALKALRAWFSAAKSRKALITKSEGQAGHRAGPTRAGNNDAKIGARLDYGEKFKKGNQDFLRLNFQINKGAERKTLKELANKNSHKVWATADVLLSDNKKTEDEIFDDIFDDLKTDLEKKIEEDAKKNP